MGLPVAIRAVEVGFDVIGFDIDKTRIDRLRKVETFIDDITDSDLMMAVSTGWYLPTGDPRPGSTVAGAGLTDGEAAGGRAAAG